MLIHLLNFFGVEPFGLSIKVKKASGLKQYWLPSGTKVDASMLSFSASFAILPFQRALLEV